MRTIQITIMLVFIINTANSQLSKTAKIDSLNNDYLLTQSDTAKVLVLNSLSLTYSNINMDSSLYYADLAFKLAKKKNFSEGILKGYKNYGRALINTGYYQESIIICKQGLVYVDELLKKSKNLIDKKKLQEYKISILKNLGIGFDFLAIYPEALKYYMEVLKIQEAIDDRKNSAAIYHNIGGVYLDYEKLDEALNYFQKAYKINKEYGNKMWMTNNLVNIAIVYSTQYRYDLALSTYKEALVLYEKENNSAGKLNVLSNIGTMYASMNVVDSCIFYMKKVLLLNQEIGDPRIDENAYLLLGKMYTNQRDFPEARKMLKEAGKIVHELDDYTLLVDYYDAMYKIDSTQGYFLNALRNLQLSFKYRDSVYNEDNIRKMTQIQMNYDFEKKAAESLIVQQKKDVEAKEELRRQKLMRNGFIAGVIVFIILFLIAFIRFREKKKLSDRLAMQKAEIEKQKVIVESQKEILEEKNEQIYASISYASTIQNAILPWENYLNNSINDYFILYKPKDIVSGDFYWFKEVEDTKFLAVIDCTGHGIPGAMLTIISSTVLDDAVLSRKLKDTGEILTYMNDKVTEVLNQRLEENKNRDGMEVALIAINQDKIQFSGAGRPLFVINEKLETYKTDKRGIAGQTQSDIYVFSSIDIEKSKNQMIFLTSDGYADQMNENSKKFSSKRFMETLDRISELPLDKQKEILENEFNTHKGNREQIDDVTVLGVKL